MDEQKSLEPEIPASLPPTGQSKWQRFRTWYGAHQKWTIPASVFLLLIILASVPWTRYKAAGLLLKQNFNVKIVDSVSGTPVSGALVSFGSLNAQTDATGRAIFKNVKVGQHTFTVSKKYYQDGRFSALVPILKQKKVPDVKIVATGRQVKLVIKDLVSKKPLSGVDIEVAGTSAKTDKDGTAIIVVPAGVSSQKAKLSLSGYNDANADVKISDSQVLENDFALTPAGKVYFLSKRTGKLDLMKVNLDGSSAQVVVAGSGYEHDYDTTLLPSPDWKYVALVAKRSATDPTPQLYVLSTADDKLLSVDSGNADFSLQGWSDNYLIYTVTNNDTPTWQIGKNKLKSYNAATGKLTLLDQSAAAGDASASAYESYAFITIYANNVFYAKDWLKTYYGSTPDLLSGKQNSAAIINPNGQGSKPIANYDPTGSVQYVQHAPNAVYIWQRQNSSDNFYDYTIGLSGPKAISLTSDQFYQSYPSYYTSPFGKQTFWAENRDGKNTLFVGDASGNNAATVASLSDYSPYAWFSDNYLLVSKGGSELYIMSAKGGKAIKITDYQPTAYAGGI